VELLKDLEKAEIPSGVGDCDGLRRGLQIHQRRVTVVAKWLQERTERTTDILATNRSEATPNYSQAIV
jgi:hypothetical protein